MATNPLLSFIGNAARQGVANFLNQGATQPAAPATQPAAPAALTPQQEATQRFNRAYYAYLANPDMPLDPSESTGTLRGDQQALARARAARMLAAGQSAVAERAQAQGRLFGTDLTTGMPIVGNMPEQQIVQESPGGVRVAYRNGIPVGFSTPQRALNQEERLFNKPFQTDVAARRRQIEAETNALPAAQRASIAARLGVENTPSAIANALSAGIQSAGSVAPSPEQGEAIRRRATELAAEQSAARMRAAQILRAAGATAPAVAAAQAAPAAAAPAPAPARVAAPPQPVKVTKETEAVEVPENLTPEELIAEADRRTATETPELASRPPSASVQTKIVETQAALRSAMINNNAEETRRLRGLLRLLTSGPREIQDILATSTGGASTFLPQATATKTLQTAAPKSTDPKLSPFINPELLQKPSLSTSEYVSEFKRLQAVKDNQSLPKEIRDQADRQISMLMDIDHKQDNLKDSSPFIKPELLEKTSMGAFEFSGEMERLYAIKTDMRFDEATRKQAEKQLRMLENIYDREL
jgi:hypothetical protein